MTSVGQIESAIEDWAPPATAQSYDNVGLLVGDREAEVSRALVALDLTTEIVEEASARNCELIITHHPTIFDPLKRVTTDSYIGSMISRLLRNSISLISAHTNLDAVIGGVSFELGKRLGLSQLSLLDPMKDSLYKVVTFVPEKHFDEVRTAAADAGAGVIGNYDSCGYALSGTGYFRALEGSNPFVGNSEGEVHSEDEIRFEVEVRRWELRKVVDAIVKAHPYEEVAYDVYPVVQTSRSFGLGAIGNLASPVTLRVFLQQLCNALQTSAVRFTGSPETMVSRVAVCGGSGSSLISRAMHAGAHVFVTGDVTYHRHFEVLNPSGGYYMALVDAGHYETEFMTEALLCRRLDAQFDAVEFLPSQIKTSPIQTFIATRSGS